MPLFPTPAHVVCFYDPQFHERRRRFTNWQFSIHYDFAVRDWDSAKRCIAVCPNGGGKSAYILGPQAVWTALSFYRSLTAVTSASSEQLDSQTMPAMKHLAELINEYHRSEFFNCRTREITFNPNHSPIRARKSDKEGLQEGFHPLSGGEEFTILVDEGKSIPDEIYAGIAKWTGFTRRTDISSAGEPVGAFYRMVTEPPKNVKPYIITDDMCPHIRDADREVIYSQGGGPDSILARQALKSQFVSLAGQVVLTLDTVMKCIKMAQLGKIEWQREQTNKCGLDISGGGDETIMCIANGNKQLALEVIPSKETTFQVERIIAICKQYELTDPNKRKSDAGGMGKQILDLLARAGWPFVRVYNQSKPVSRGRFNFGNRGTDMWFRFSRLVEDCQILLLDDPKLKLQLSTRLYRQKLDSDKIILQPKPEAKHEGRPSPDRADATALCFEDYVLEQRKEEGKKRLTGEELEQWYDDLHHGNFTNPAKLDGQITLEDLVGMRRQPDRFPKL